MEFNLSKKMKDWVQPTTKEEKDIKEFIRLLKEEYRKEMKLRQTKDARNDLIACKLLEDLYFKPLFQIIDKLAGEKLC